MFDIRFQSVSKRYLLRRAQARRWGTRPENELWALSNVTFEVERGEALGIIGHNGAGKTTILRLLSGITAPTKGEILIRGRLGSLVELGAGFHPELS
ncbi:MAG: ABC transporter ATP-binding protein, partial [Acidobacteriia bacterium]|nr:ABC transporter ATP-binding protein [Terriglobia bacterium]